MIYIEKSDIHATLATWLYCAFHMLYNAERKGRTGYIHWPAGKSLIDLYDVNKFAGSPNMFDWYFKQPHCPYKDKATGVWTWEKENWGENVDTNDYSLISSPVKTIRNYYKHNLIFNDEVNARGQALVEKYNIDFSKTIGVTWRGTDIYLESQNGNKGRHYIPIERYFKWIDKALEEIPDALIMCTSEEAGRLDPLLQRYPQAFVVEEFTSAPHGSKHNPERFMPKSGFERGMQPVLIMWLMSKCAWYIKVRSSMAAIAGWISDGNIVSIGHSEGLYYENPDEWLNVDEFKGEKIQA
jgi:hypothetical protein